MTEDCSDKIKEQAEFTSFLPCEVKHKMNEQSTNIITILFEIVSMIAEWPKILFLESLFISNQSKYRKQSVVINSQSIEFYIELVPSS